MVWNRSSSLTPEQVALFTRTMNETIEGIGDALKTAGYSPEQVVKILGDERVSRAIHDKIADECFPEFAEYERRQRN